MPRRISRNAAASTRIANNQYFAFERLGAPYEALGTTRSEIAACLAALPPDPHRTIEVETYAWTVLPEGLQTGRLADGIAAEIRWLREALA